MHLFLHINLMYSEGQRYTVHIQDLINMQFILVHKSWYIVRSNNGYLELDVVNIICQIQSKLIPTHLKDTTSFSHEDLFFSPLLILPLEGELLCIGYKLESASLNHNYIPIFTVNIFNLPYKHEVQYFLQVSVFNINIYLRQIH